MVVEREKKNSKSELIKATEEAACKTTCTGQGKMYVLCTGYSSPIFSKMNDISSVNVRKKLSHVAVTCFEALVVVCCLLMKCLAVFWHC